MLLRFKYRLYPNSSQRDALPRAFGCARVVYNDGLRLRQEAFAAGLGFIDDGELQKRVITQAKRTQERAWLSEVSPVVLIQTLRDLNRAYRGFFTARRGERQVRAVGLPRFKSKRDARQAIRLTSNAFALRDDGKLHVAECGIDLGLTHKARSKLVRQHAKVADRRRDWHHRESTRIIRENQAVFVEDLAVAALGRTRSRSTVSHRPRRPARPAVSGLSVCRFVSGSGSVCAAGCDMIVM